MVLTKDTGVPQKGSLLTNKRDVPFITSAKKARKKETEMLK